MSKSSTPSANHGAKPLAVFTSDWHLKPYTWMAYPQLKGDAYHSAYFIADYCIRNNLPLFVLGDILDKREPDSYSVYVLTSIIQRMETRGLPFNFLQGQHELQRDMPWASVVQGSYWLDLGRIPFTLGPFTYFAFDYQPPDRIQEALDQIPEGTDILLCHQVWKERMGGQSIAARGCDGAFTDVPHVKMVISGDFHGHRVTKHKGKNGQELQAVSPGSTYQKTIDEDNLKFFYVLYDNMELESVQIPTRPCVRARVNTEDALDAAIDDFKKNHGPIDDEHPDKPIWHVEFRLTIPDAYARLKQAAEGRAHLFERPIPVRLEAEYNDDSQGDEAVAEHGPRSLEDFIGLRSEPGSPVHQTAVRLSRATDIKGEVKQIASEAVEASDKASEGNDPW